MKDKQQVNKCLYSGLGVLFLFHFTGEGGRINSALHLHFKTKGRVGWRETEISLREHIHWKY